MKWGSFTSVHITSLVAAAGILAALYMLLRKRSDRVQTAVLGVLSFSGIAAIVYNFVTAGTLPLQLCSLNALLLPVLVFTRSQLIGNLLMAWGLGAAAALVYNVGVADAPVFGITFNLYYFPHVLECGIPWVMIALGKVRKDPRFIPSTVGITVSAYTLVYFVNVVLERAFGGAVYCNYMYSLWPTTSLAQHFWDLLPCRYWYMYLALPILTLFLAAVYAPQLARSRRLRKMGEMVDRLLPLPKSNGQRGDAQ
ncbi:MAG: YwaF family protein [Firmicutes bacterium]|nr:YwaF family protein [Bacillota bacterium]